MTVSNQHSTLDEIGQERIPDELLPEGVGPAWWDPQIMRLHAEAHCAHRYDHEMTTKAWVILHLMNERERLVEQLETARAEVQRLRDEGITDITRREVVNVENERLKEQFEALRRENKALYAEMARLPNRQAAEAFGRVREYIGAVGPLCGDPCPEAPDLDSCLLPEGHGGDWHQNRSSSWPVSNPASEPK